MKRNGFTLIELMIVGAILGILAAVALPVVSTPNGIMPNYSNGERTGVINKVSQKGIIYKSYEAELLMTTQGNIAPEKFSFSVDPAAVEEVKQAATSGKTVTVIYSQFLLKPWKIETRYLVRDVK